MPSFFWPFECSSNSLYADRSGTVEFFALIFLPSIPKVNFNNWRDERTVEVTSLLSGWHTRILHSGWRSGCICMLLTFGLWKKINVHCKATGTVRVPVYPMIHVLYYQCCTFCHAVHSSSSFGRLRTLLLETRYLKIYRTSKQGRQLDQPSTSSTHRLFPFQWLTVSRVDNAIEYSY